MLALTVNPDITLLLSYYDSQLSLLLTFSQSRTGAVHIMNAGLFQAVRASGLFSVDPDMGIGKKLAPRAAKQYTDYLEIDNPEALSKYYRLILSVVRVITSVVISRGSQNIQTIENAKAFLVENRPLVVAIFKRRAKIGGTMSDNVGVHVDELEELLTLLIAMTEFLDVSRPLIIYYLGLRLTESPSSRNREIPRDPTKEGSFNHALQVDR